MKLRLTSAQRRARRTAAIHLWAGSIILAFSISAFLAVASAVLLEPDSCVTDTECMAMCHPDDSDCDGGPR